MNNLIISEKDALRLRERMHHFRQSSVNFTKEINKLTNELSRAQVVEPTQIPMDVVTMHSIIKLKYLQTDKELEMEIVYPEEADIKKNKISIFAPIATALLGYRKGDVIDWEVPSGKVQIRIEDILYQPEAAGDFHL
ncbi:RNA polymerase-binding protein Rnk [Adhaeribacter aerolatus]|uniref:RNA polymerase-binding protein Rnk n=1 Tax=Adhaeribacter aerolatus TaxID=670289 RepID=A0A512B6G2_9BACT|nr:nucleoside diphosphate kinase regulator [Adhaeribacter aerolatus]GEO07367.1 RNA polymerase-binding protein Rnk [Adhaeribacter aerolatus]